jgi:histidinol-phosphatase (PHP family)
MEEYIKLIEKGQIEGIGFAEHLEFLPECGAYKFLDYNSYISEIKRYEQEGFKIYAGAEVDYVRDIETEILEELQIKSFDYTICSVHMVKGSAVSDKKDVSRYEDINTFSDVLDIYYNEISSSLKVKEFDVIGHVGIYKRYLSPDFFEDHILADKIEELDNEAARLCALSGKILEINSSGLFFESASPLPDFKFLKKYYDYGGRIVSVGSDAHNVLHTARGFNIVFEMLSEIGIKYIYLPWDVENPIKIGK